MGGFVSWVELGLLVRGLGGEGVGAGGWTEGGFRCGGGRVSVTEGEFVENLDEFR